jgi:hypothetical protein
MSASISISVGQINDTSIDISYNYNLGFGNTFLVVGFLQDDVQVGISSNPSQTVYTYNSLNPLTSYTLKTRLTTSNGAGTSSSVTSNQINTQTTCYVKGTEILCENDSYVKIEDLSIGDNVKTIVGCKK